MRPRRATIPHARPDHRPGRLPRHPQRLDRRSALAQRHDRAARRKALERAVLARRRRRPGPGHRRLRPGTEGPGRSLLAAGGSAPPGAAADGAGLSAAPGDLLPGADQRAAKHPTLVAVKLWAVAHLLANGTLADLLLFGGFLAWAVADRIAVKRRPAAEAHGCRAHRLGPSTTRSPSSPACSSTRSSSSGHIAGSRAYRRSADRGRFA